MNAGAMLRAKEVKRCPCVQTPTILHRNPCKIYSESTDFFMPAKQFDYVWAYEIMAGGNYKDYRPPPEMLFIGTKTTPVIRKDSIQELIDMEKKFDSNLPVSIERQVCLPCQPSDLIRRGVDVLENRTCSESADNRQVKCAFSADIERIVIDKGHCAACKVHQQQTASITTDPQRSCEHLDEFVKDKSNRDGDDDTCWRHKRHKGTKRANDAETDYSPSMRIANVEEQQLLFRSADRRKQSLTHAFANASFPWYIERPMYDYALVLNEDLLGRFKTKFEQDIIYNMERFQCKLIIVHISGKMCPQDLQFWLKFADYMYILGVTRCPMNAHRLPLFGKTFHALLVDDYGWPNWHMDLNHCLQAGYEYAIEHKLLPTSNTPFVYVFANKSKMCFWNAFTILRNA